MKSFASLAFETLFPTVFCAIFVVFYLSTGGPTEKVAASVIAAITLHANRINRRLDQLGV